MFSMFAGAVNEATSLAVTAPVPSSDYLIVSVLSN
jgi:hypothetical protein